MLRNLVRLTFVFIGWMIPRLLRLLGLMFFLSATSITSLFVGVPTAVERIADSWTEEATSNGIPLGTRPELRNGLIALAYLVLILGWVVIIGVVIFLIQLLVSG